MQSIGTASIYCAFALGSLVTLTASRATAQMAMPGGGRSLGGYGAGAGMSSGSAGGAYIPYMGNASGFVPYSAGRGGGLGTQPIARRLSSTAVGGTMMADTPIGGASLQATGSGRGGMAMGGGTSTSRRPQIPFGYEAGKSMGSPMSMGGMSARRPYGPGFVYPFRIPPSLTGSAGMAMP